MQGAALHSNGNGAAHNLLLLQQQQQQGDSLVSTPSADGKKSAEIDAPERNPFSESDASERNLAKTDDSHSNAGMPARQSTKFWNKEETSSGTGCGKDMAVAGDASVHMNAMPMARDECAEDSDMIAMDRLLGQGKSDVFEMEVIPATQTSHNHALEDGHLGQAQTINMDKLHEKEAIGVLHHKSRSGMGSESSRLTSSIASTTCEEFFDAPTDVPFDDSASEDDACSSISNTRRLPRSFENLTPLLQEEIARRIRAEESLASMQLRWNEMAKRCSLIGLSMSSGPIQDGTLERGSQIVQDPSNQFSEQLMVARLVGGAIASAAVRAIKDEELESMLAVKNREISRLWDKLQYVELVNREMSQRNQEVIEIAQRRKRRRRKRQKWAFGCFCAAFCVGSAGLLCYRYFPWDQAEMWTKSMNKLTKNEPIMPPELDSI